MTEPHRLERSQRIERPLSEVFAFFADAANLERITPAYLRFRIVTKTPIVMVEGTRIDYRISLLGVPMRWRTLISAWQPGVCFVDEQELGPYAVWRHTHRFEAAGSSTLIHDLVEYREPFGLLGDVAHTLFVARTLERIFDYRREATRKALENGAPEPPTH